jgi:hypothetical protein
MVPVHHWTLELSFHGLVQEVLQDLTRILHTA